MAQKNNFFICIPYSLNYYKVQPEYGDEQIQYKEDLLKYFYEIIPTQVHRAKFHLDRNNPFVVMLETQWIEEIGIDRIQEETRLRKAIVDLSGEGVEKVVREQQKEEKKKNVWKNNIFDKLFKRD